MPIDAQTEIESGERFAFGENWSRFLNHLTEERILEAEQSVKTMLQEERLDGKSFLDIGCGSGLFSLAARRLGAKVHSLDFDLSSVRCAQELRTRFFPDAGESWVIEQGSVLNREYLERLGTYDIVYSWGVLHHTGSMWKAIENASCTVAPGGRFFLSIYNDQGTRSAIWVRIKKFYNSSLFGKAIAGSLGVAYFALQIIVAKLLKGENPITFFRNYAKFRGMSIMHDWIDWIGGYPFEVAKPEEIFDFLNRRGFFLEKMITTNDLGVNEFVFRLKQNQK